MVVKKKTERWIIAHGNPVDGMKFIGPFNSHEEAIEAAENDEPVGDREWWIVPLDAPENVK